MLEIGLVHRSADFFPGRRQRLRLRPFRPPRGPVHAVEFGAEALMDCGGPLAVTPRDVRAVLTSRTIDRILRRFSGSVEIQVEAGAACAYLSTCPPLPRRRSVS